MYDDKGIGLNLPVTLLKYMSMWNKILAFTVILLFTQAISAQVIINEGSNKNYLSVADEDNDYPDWIEIYNAGNTQVNLEGYSLTDDPLKPRKWIFPSVMLEPGSFKVVFCSGKDRKPVTSFVNVLNASNYTPVTGWNTHLFSTPFYWDGNSNILINTCSYNSTGYTSNSVFRQTATPYPSTVFAFQDYSSVACTYDYGTAVYQRPNMKMNGKIIGTGTLENSPYSYPAPYGNWYWCARNQMLVRASELTQAGLTAGYISSLSFSVVSTDPNTVYDYIDINMKMVTDTAVAYHFQPIDPHKRLHTNFKISNDGEAISLFSPIQTLISTLFVNCTNLDNSNGLYPDGTSQTSLFRTSTPETSNNESSTYSGYMLPPAFSMPSGVYSSILSIEITNPNGPLSEIHYTTDGSDPTVLSPVYTGSPVQLIGSGVLKACVTAEGYLNSPATTANYLINVSHNTPILAVATDNNNLYGPNGIFDNWWLDWNRPAYIEYFDSTNQQIFSQRAAMQMDGGAGGSRSHPQHSFRLEPDHSVLGDGPIDYALIPDRPMRQKYSRFYLRNGSNQYLVLPYKDAAAVKAMGRSTNNYYSAWRPVTVYINGSYFGLYELREKFDKEYFRIHDDAGTDSLDILSLSYWYGGILRPVEGSVENFWKSAEDFKLIEPADTAFWDKTDQIFDLTYYNDYIIAESWIANSDWIFNNIKLYRSDKTGYKWRFCLIDLELALAPNGWTDYTTDHIQFMLGADPANPYINIWQKGMQNGRFRNYFINRYADIMNTAYQTQHLLDITRNMFDLTKTEMQNEYIRWGDPNNVFGQMLNFYQNHNTFQSQLMLRTEQVRNHLVSNFGLVNQVNVTLDVDPPGAGSIKISTITPDEYPWQGVYFNGIPVKIEALPNEGYGFLNWNSNGLIRDTLSPVFCDTLAVTAADFKANFISTVTVPENTETGITVYPNPATDNIFVTNNRFENMGSSRYEIYNLNGRPLMEGLLTPGKKTSNIDIRHLPPSIYIIRITSGEKLNQVTRFVKIR